MAKLLLILTFLAFGVFANTNPGFSLHNKSKFPIQIKLLIGNKEYTGPVPPGEFKNFEINYKRDLNTRQSEGPITLKIMANNGRLLNWATFIEGKTLYLNWDELHVPRLYPQRGPYLGITKKTDLGFPTANNIQEIKEPLRPQINVVGGQFLSSNEQKEIASQGKPAKSPYAQQNLPDPSSNNFCADIYQVSNLKPEATNALRKDINNFRPKSAKIAETIPSLKNCKNNSLCEEVQSYILKCYMGQSDTKDEYYHMR